MSCAAASFSPGEKQMGETAALYEGIRDARGSLALKASWKEQPAQALHSLGPLNNSDVVESSNDLFLCPGPQLLLKSPHSPDTSAAGAQFIMSGTSHITGRTSQKDKQEGTLRVASFGGIRTEDLADKALNKPECALLTTSLYPGPGSDSTTRLRRRLNLSLESFSFVMLMLNIKHKQLRTESKVEMARKNLKLWQKTWGGFNQIKALPFIFHQLMM